MATHIPRSMSVKPSAFIASAVLLSMVSKQRLASWGSSNNLAYYQNTTWRYQQITRKHSSGIWKRVRHKNHLSEKHECIVSSEMFGEKFHTITLQSRDSVLLGCVESCHHSLWTDVNFIRVKEPARWSKATWASTTTSATATVTLSHSFHTKTPMWLR